MRASQCDAAIPMWPRHRTAWHEASGHGRGNPPAPPNARNGLRSASRSASASLAVLQRAPRRTTYPLLYAKHIHDPRPPDLYVEFNIRQRRSLATGGRGERMWHLLPHP